MRGSRAQERALRGMKNIPKKIINKKQTQKKSRQIFSRKKVRTICYRLQFDGQFLVLFCNHNIPVQRERSLKLMISSKQRLIADFMMESFVGRH
jgi:hypothetical protein